MQFNCRDDIIQITAAWNGERFDDGRPRVPDDILRRLRDITFEEAWGPMHQNGYPRQYECRFRMTQPERRLVGRAVTCVMVPQREDLNNAMLQQGQQREHRRGTFNQWVIDNLVEGDVVVVDLFDKIINGTFVGGNLSTAIASRTKNGGAVIWGGIRDLEQIVKIQDFQCFYRGVDPNGIGEVTMVGINIPCRIGAATCLPGDIVLGTISGVIFIPPHLAESVCIHAEKSHLRDIFGFQRLKEHVYTTAQIDTAWTYDMMKDFVSWANHTREAEPYRHLDWTEELNQARQREANVCPKEDGNR